MPQQTECHTYSSDPFVSDIDYSEAQNILEQTTMKQKQLRRQRSQILHKQLLLKRTYTLVCELLNSDCSNCTNQISLCDSSPLSAIDINKRKTIDDDDINHRSLRKKSKSLMDKCYDITNDNDVLQFLRELNSIKIPSRY